MTPFTFRRRSLRGIAAALQICNARNDNREEDTMMSRRSTWFALSALLFAACAGDFDPASDGDSIGQVEEALTTGSFTTSYTGGSSSTCGTSYTITGQEPTTAGTYPVFLYMVGTTESATNASATAAVAQMAAKGYVAATIAYDSGSFNNCSVIGAKAKCMFDSTKSTSATGVLCARAKADCSKGIVVGGFSQGSVIATQAKNYDSRVRAAWGMGDGIKYSTYDLTSCQANGNHVLSNQNLLAIVGEKDQFV